MKTPIKYLPPLCALLVLSTAALAQKPANFKNNDRRVESVGRGTALVIVGSAAKGTWAVAAFTAKTIAKPVAKTVFLKATPAVTKFALKTAAKQAVPLMLKLSAL